MFKRNHRFLFSKPLPQKVISTPFYSVRYQNADDKTYKVAIVVGKKVSPKAVERNRIKRQLSALLERHLSDSNTEELVFFLRKKILDVSRNELSKDLEQLLSKIGIIEQ